MAKTECINSLPARGIIEDRLEEQRRRIWRAQSICNITALAARRAQGVGNEGDAAAFTQNAWSAMEAVGILLEDVAGDLEPDVVLDRRAAAGEGTEEARERALTT